MRATLALLLTLTSGCSFLAGSKPHLGADGRQHCPTAAAPTMDLVTGLAVGGLGLVSTSICSNGEACTEDGGTMAAGMVVVGAVLLASAVYGYGAMSGCTVPPPVAGPGPGVLVPQ
jgi:hypothetical protein